MAGIFDGENRLPEGDPENQGYAEGGGGIDQAEAARIADELAGGMNDPVRDAAKLAEELLAEAEGDE